MKRSPSIVAVLLFVAAELTAGATPAAAQPAPVDPYAAPTPAPAKPKKPVKGKGKKPGAADAGGAAAVPAGDALPTDPYGFGGPIPMTTAKPSGPLDPYVPPPAKPVTPPAVGTAPVDPYATPTPAPAPTPPKPGAGSAPVDPYAPPAPAPVPTPTKPGAGTTPVDPYAPAPTKPGAGSAPVDPYAPTPTPTPTPTPPKPGAGTTPVDPYAAPSKPPAPPPPPPPGGVTVDPYGLGTADAAPGAAPDAAPISGSATGRLDVAAVQGLLAVQNLDAWLLADVAGQNTVAHTLVAPAGTPTRRWFYLIPRKGEPTLLCHTAEAGSFAALPGKHQTYAGYRDLDRAVKALLKGKKNVAMEYSPKGALPSLSRVDAGTLELVRGAAVTVKSSEVLVQFVKSTWGPQGRRSHYVAVHHLVELRKDALAFIRDQLASGKPVTELDVQQRIGRGMALRGLSGPPAVVAFGVHTADPDYTPTPERAATLRRGDVVLLGLAGKIDGGVYAALTWVAIAERSAPVELAATFDAAARARDEALAFIRDRLKRRRAVQGWEVDHAARDFLTRGGLDSHAIHRTGHSLDTDLQGSGTDLDDLEVKDKRALVVGTGFTVGPGLYYPGELGVRTEVSVFLGKDGLEITTPVQDRVEPLLGP